MWWLGDFGEEERWGLGAIWEQQVSPGCPACGGEGKGGSSGLCLLQQQQQEQQWRLGANGQQQVCPG